jgi:hypothetical protein
MNRRPLEEQYRDHINELRRQLKNAYLQVQRIPYLEEAAKYSFEKWCAQRGYSILNLKEDEV